MNKSNIFLIALVFLGLTIFSPASADIGVSLPNPLCLSGSEGTCNVVCNGTAWQTHTDSSGNPYTSFAACCADQDFPITDGTGTCINSFPSLISTISTYIVGVIGALALVIFIWAGILFVTSAGNPGQIEKAKKALMYAVIGIALALAGGGLIAVITAVIGAPP